MSKSKKKPNASRKQKEVTEWNETHFITQGIDKGKDVMLLSTIEGDPEICEVEFRTGAKRIIMSKFLKAIE